MTLQTFGLIIVSVTISAVAQICLKLGMSSRLVQQAIASPGLSAIIYAVLTNVAVLGGLSLYVAGAMVWLSVLARVNVSLAYPFIGLGLLITLAFAVLMLGEPLSWPIIAGTSLIVAGIVVLTTG